MSPKGSEFSSPQPAIPHVLPYVHVLSDAEGADKLMENDGQEANTGLEQTSRDQQKGSLQVANTIEGPTQSAPLATMSSRLNALTGPGHLYDAEATSQWREDLPVRLAGFNEAMQASNLEGAEMDSRSLSVLPGAHATPDYAQGPVGMIPANCTADESRTDNTPTDQASTASSLTVACHENSPAASSHFENSSSDTTPTNHSSNKPSSSKRPTTAKIQTFHGARRDPNFKDSRRARRNRNRRNKASAAIDVRLQPASPRLSKMWHDRLNQLDQHRDILPRHRSRFYMSNNQDTLPAVRDNSWNRADINIDDLLPDTLDVPRTDLQSLFAQFDDTGQRTATQARANARNSPLAAIGSSHSDVQARFAQYDAGQPNATYPPRADARNNPLAAIGSPYPDVQAQYAQSNISESTVRQPSGMNTHRRQVTAIRITKPNAQGQPSQMSIQNVQAPAVHPLPQKPNFQGQFTTSQAPAGQLPHMGINPQHLPQPSGPMVHSLPQKPNFGGQFDTSQPTAGQAPYMSTHNAQGPVVHPLPQKPNFQGQSTTSQAPAGQLPHMGINPQHLPQPSGPMVHPLPQKPNFGGQLNTGQAPAVHPLPPKPNFQGKFNTSQAPAGQLPHMGINTQHLPQPYDPIVFTTNQGTEFSVPWVAAPFPHGGIDDPFPWVPALQAPSDYPPPNIAYCPSADTYGFDKHMVVNVLLAGAKRDDVYVRIHPRYPMIYVNGHINPLPDRGSVVDGNVIIKELTHGMFARCFWFGPLYPFDDFIPKFEDMKVTLVDGLLAITVPKRDPERDFYQGSYKRGDSENSAVFETDSSDSNRGDSRQSSRQGHRGSESEWGLPTDAEGYPIIPVL